jgi:hypothetical protein
MIGMLGFVLTIVRALLNLRRGGGMKWVRLSLYILPLWLLLTVEGTHLQSERALRAFEPSVPTQ